MPLSSLEITCLRNISSAKFQPSAYFNVFSGDNGSGKTSLLEAIYLLGMGRSFRSTRINPLIQHNQPVMSVFAKINEHSIDFDEDNVSLTTIGVQRRRDNQHYRIKVNGDVIDNLSMLVKQLPIKVIHADSFQLLSGAPKLRRKFLDWGVFHVEHSYMAVWQKFQRCLRNRNELLKQGYVDEQLLKTWDQALVTYAVEIDNSRQQYIDQFLPVINALVEGVSGLSGVSIIYQRGWPDDESLEDVLRRKYDIDKRYGSTQYGPHRANLAIYLDGVRAELTLSRGQQKLLVSLMTLAQGKLLKLLTNRKSIYLLDDLPSELDIKYQEMLCDCLYGLESQVFITAIQGDALQEMLASHGRKMTMFHVEHGQLL